MRREFGLPCVLSSKKRSLTTDNLFNVVRNQVRLFAVPRNAKTGRR